MPGVACAPIIARLGPRAYLSPRRSYLFSIAT
jgi:hypothetical protein